MRILSLKNLSAKFELSINHSNTIARKSSLHNRHNDPRGNRNPLLFIVLVYRGMRLLYAHLRCALHRAHLHSPATMTTRVSYRAAIARKSVLIT